jgi:hypothetical protein
MQRPKNRLESETVIPRTTVAIPKTGLRKKTLVFQHRLLNGKAFAMN